MLSLTFLMMLLTPSVVSAETWLCKQPDGTEVFSNTGSGENCIKYEPKSEFVRPPAGATGPTNPADYQERPIPPRTRSLHNPNDTAVETKQPGEITFEQFRMLTRGWTEGQVLAKLGPPMNRTTISCVLKPQEITCPVLWTYLMPEGWTADLIFASGRLESFTNSRP